MRPRVVTLWQALRGDAPIGDEEILSDEEIEATLREALFDPRLTQERKSPKRKTGAMGKSQLGAVLDRRLSSANRDAVRVAMEVAETRDKAKNKRRVRIRKPNPEK